MAEGGPCRVRGATLEGGGRGGACRWRRPRILPPHCYYMRVTQSGEGGRVASPILTEEGLRRSMSPCTRRESAGEWSERTSKTQVRS